jgi:glycosyltransferase involved in cell wall biosynthesis
VVTPSHNQARYLEAALQSVLSQSHENVEYIVIDGGSSDDSRGILQRYSDRLAYWVSEPDGGQAAAINKGLRRAHGVVWAWLNSDDVYAPAALARAARFLAEHDEIDIVYGDVRFVDETGRELGTMSAWDFDPKLQMCATNLVLQPACFFRRAIFENVGGLDETLHFALDYDLWVRMVIAGARFAHVSEVWADYRLHPESKTEAQAGRFGAEVRRVVEKASAGGALPAAWRPVAESNLEQLIAETHLRLGQTSEARRHFLRAVRHFPWRSKSLGLLAYAVDLRLGQALRRWRWRLAGRKTDAWQSLLR